MAGPADAGDSRFPPPMSRPKSSADSSARARPVLAPRAILARVAVALAAFALVGLGMRAVAAPAGGGVIGAKLEYWDAHADEFDTVFLGSSHVLRAFVPEEFDREMTAAGYECSSFNFGVQAVHLIE